MQDSTTVAPAAPAVPATPASRSGPPHREFPGRWTVVTFLLAAMLASAWMAARIDRSLPGYQAENWFFAFFWSLFGLGLAAAAWWSGAGWRMTAFALAFFLAGAALGFLVGAWGLLLVGGAPAAWRGGRRMLDRARARLGRRS